MNDNLCCSLILQNQIHSGFKEQYLSFSRTGVVLRDETFPFISREQKSGQAIVPLCADFLTQSTASRATGRGVCLRAIINSTEAQNSGRRGTKILTISPIWGSISLETFFKKGLHVCLIQKSWSCRYRPLSANEPGPMKAAEDSAPRYVKPKNGMKSQPVRHSLLMC